MRSFLTYGFLVLLLCLILAPRISGNLQRLERRAVSATEECDADMAVAVIGAPGIGPGLAYLSALNFQSVSHFNLHRYIPVRSSS